MIVQSLARIAELNEGEPHAPFGVTAFADMTQHEFAAKYMIGPEYINQHAVETAGVLVLPQLSLQDLPLEFDWRSVNGTSYVTPVKNQGVVLIIQIFDYDMSVIGWHAGPNCGSCYAFSAVENIESVWAIAGHNLTMLSVQQVVDCDTFDDGCNGGDVNNAFKYVIDAGGLETEHVCCALQLILSRSKT